MASGFTGTYLEQALFSDANLRFPKGQVRLNPGVRVAVTPDALVISGPGGRQQLKCGTGKAIQVARILQRAIDPDTHVLDMPAIDNKLLSLLHAAGALEAAGEAMSVGELDSFSGFLAGTRDSSRRFASTEELSRMVTGRRVCIAATGDLDLIGEILADETVSIEKSDAETILANLGFEVSNPIVDRLLDPRTSDGYCLTLIEEAAVEGRKLAPSWLVISVAVNNSIVRLVLRGDRWFQNAPDFCETCCHELIDTIVDQAHIENPGDLDMACALQAQEIINLAAEINHRPADTSITLLSGRTPFRDGALLGYLAKGACESCKDDVGTRERTQVLAFTALTDFTERHTIDPKGHQVHYLASNLAAQSRPRTKVVPGAYEDPVVRDAWMGDAAPDWLTSAVVAIRYSVGVREHNPMKVQRYTASGGNMGSTSALLEVSTDDRSSYYLYDDQRDHFVDVATSAIVATPPAKDGVATVHLVAGIGRLGPKYGHLAYRISLADAGTALGTVQDYAHAHGVDISVDWNRPADCDVESALVGEGHPVVAITFNPPSNEESEK